MDNMKSIFMNSKIPNKEYILDILKEEREI